MKISCPACAAKYSIADEKVQEKLAKIRCRKCGTTIVIDGKVSPPNVYAGESGASNVDQPAVSDPGMAGVAAGEYSVDFGDNDQRTMSLADLIAAYNNGQVTGETFVWAEGMGDWSPLGEVQAIVEALHAASSAPSASPPAAAVAPAASPMVGGGAPWEAPRIEPQSAQRAAARAGGRSGSTSDLFGAFDTAGSEHDVTTSAREPAIGLGGHGAAAAAAAGGASATGARNESSVLFSLSALTSASGPKPTPTPSNGGPLSSSNITIAGAPTGTKEDSGLIDLKALTASADANAQPIAQPAPLGMAPPLGLSAPVSMGLGGVEAQITMPQQKSRAGIYIGAGIAVAAVAIAAAIIVTNKTPPPPAPTVAAPTPPPPPAPTPTPENTDGVTAKPPSTGNAEEEKAKTASNKARPTGGKVGSKTAAPAGGDTKTAPAGGDTKKPPPVAKNPCGCAAGDLQCNMRCSAGG